MFSLKPPADSACWESPQSSWPRMTSWSLCMFCSSLWGKNISLPPPAVNERTWEFDKVDIPQHLNSWRKFSQAKWFKELSKIPGGYPRSVSSWEQQDYFLMYSHSHLSCLCQARPDRLLVFIPGAGVRCGGVGSCNPPIIKNSHCSPPKSHNDEITWVNCYGWRSLNHPNVEI